MGGQERRAPLQRFIVQHDSGKLLHNSALDHLRKSYADINLGEWCEKVEKQIADTETMYQETIRVAEGRRARVHLQWRDRNMATDSHCKKKADVLMAKFHLRMATNIRQQHLGRTAATKASFGSWLAGESVKTDACADLAENDHYDLTDYMNKFLPLAMYEPTMSEDQAYYKLRQLITYVCRQVAWVR
jgi:hypothetical protein